jgi:hypothetical protein
MHLTTQPSMPESYESPEPYDDDYVSQTRLKVLPESPETRTAIVCPECGGFVCRNEGSAWQRATAETAEVSEQEATIVFRCRPCLFIACRYHLYTDINQRTGTIKLNFPDAEPVQLEYSCTLDEADAGPSTVAKAARILNLSRDRTHQLETKAVEKLKGLAKTSAHELDTLRDFVAK